MITLAIELSTTTGSVALFRDNDPVDDLSWSTAPRNNQILFDSLQALVSRNGLAFADLDCIAVGRGPGNYSGLRMSITAAQALALPGGIAVHSVSSGHAAAVASGEPLVAVIGDARRGLCWYGVISDNAVVLDWALAPFADLPVHLPADAVLLSPDAQRLTDQHDVEAVLPGRWPSADLVPSALHIGRLAIQRRQQGVPGETPVPLYVQPAV